MGPGGDEKFCLRWNDFQESILSTLQDLRAEEDFVDVTLVCEGGHQVAAHKLILSACSDFFRHLLRRTPAPNPVIVLWDVGVDDLRKILRFMYNGEVEVRQAHLNSFLAVAERLRVRGLCQSGGKGSPNPDRRGSSPRPGGSGSRSTSPSARRKRSPDEPDRKRQRTDGDEDNDDDGDGEDGAGGMSIKEESGASAGAGGGSKDVENRSDGGGDYGEFPAGPGSSGSGAFDEHSAGALPALMGKKY